MVHETRVELPMHCIDLVHSENLIILFHTLHSSPCCKSRSFPESEGEILCIISESSLVYFKPRYGSSAASAASRAFFLLLENIEVLQKIPRKAGVIYEVPAIVVNLLFWIKCYHKPSLVGRYAAPSPDGSKRLLPELACGMRIGMSTQHQTSLQ
jgi:hypothetical protein